MITYYRVDQRIIHGQTCMVLIKQYPCDGILIVNDEVANDPFLKNIFKGIAPSGIKVLAYTVEKAMTKLIEAQESEKNYFVIFKHVDAVKQMVEGGYKFTGKLYLGTQHARDNTKLIDNGLYLTDQEVEMVDYIASEGVEIVVNPLIDHEPKPWREVRKAA